MICQHILEEGAGVGLHGLILRDTSLCHDLIDQCLGHDVHLSVGNLHNGIFKVRMQSDAKVSRKGPGGRGPDHEVEPAQIQMAELAFVVMDGELHVDRGDRVIVILDLRFGQGGLVMRAPVHRLKAFVDMAVPVHFAEDPHFIGLKAGVHRIVWVFPVSDNAEPLKAFHLDFGILLGISMTGAAEVRSGHFLVIELLLLDDCAFNRHAVVVPAGNIGDIAAAHHIAAVDKVLQGLVQGVTHMDISV